MKKKIKKPFDVETAKEGAIIETVDGHSVRIICYDSKANYYPIVGLISCGCLERVATYTIEGRLLSNQSTKDDLVIVEEVEETKFNVGDWVFLNNYGNQPWLVTKVTPHCYEVKDSSDHITAKSHPTIDNFYHLWTLKDAKPGDVLVDVLGHPFIYKSTGVVHFPAFPVAYCGITEEGDFEVAEEDEYWTDTRVKPATKEQRDRLFEKMEKAGYIWEAESLTLFKVLKRGIEVLITKITLL